LGIKEEGQTLTDAKEDLLIQCPLCSQQHRYKLAVERSIVVFSITSFTPSRTERTYKTFKRVFTCPTKAEPFQAVIRLEQTTGSIIHDVRVVPDDIA
jgi:hypothetical protein